MTCREASAFLLDYTSGELDAAASAEFDGHLERCPNCLHFVTQYRATIVAGRAAFSNLDADAVTELPPDVVRAILASIAKAGI